MIRIYLKNYLKRINYILVYLIIFIISMLLIAQLTNISIASSFKIIETYNEYDYDVCYVLNYSINSSEEVVYCDTDLTFYTDCKKNNRVVATSIMKKSDENIKVVSGFDFSKLMKYNEIIIPLNIAEEYNLNVGNVIYCEFPYSLELVECTIVDVSGYCYDLSDNSIINSVGVLAIGYNCDYILNFESKYLLFSRTNKNEEISIFPQVLNEIIYKNNFKSQSIFKLIAPLMLEFVFIGLLFIIYWLLIGRKTNIDLKILISKGTEKKKIIQVKTIEFIILFLFPLLLCFLIGVLIKGYLSKLYVLFVSILLIVIFLMFVVYEFLIFKNRSRNYETIRNKKFKN